MVYSEGIITNQRCPDRTQYTQYRMHKVEQLHFNADTCFHDILPSKEHNLNASTRDNHVIIILKRYDEFSILCVGH